MRIYGYIALLLISWSVAAAEVAVIANPQVPADSLSKDRLYELYTGESRHWEGDLAVVVFDLKPKGAVKEAFYKFLGKSPSRMKSVWMKRMLAGEGEPPEALASEAEIAAKVAATEGGLGFVSRENVGEGVKVLVLIGTDGEMVVP
jgi:ABC-type phosphate transport system substrate-binding protein